MRWVISDHKIFKIVIFKHFVLTSAQISGGPCRERGNLHHYLIDYTILSAAIRCQSHIFANSGTAGRHDFAFIGNTPVKVLTIRLWYPFHEDFKLNFERKMCQKAIFFLKSARMSFRCQITLLIAITSNVTSIRVFEKETGVYFLKLTKFACE